MSKLGCFPVKSPLICDLINNNPSKGYLAKPATLKYNTINKYIPLRQNIQTIYLAPIPIFSIECIQLFS